MVMSHMLYRTDQSSSVCRTVSVSTLGREDENITPTHLTVFSIIHEPIKSRE